MAKRKIEKFPYALDTDERRLLSSGITPTQALVEHSRAAKQGGLRVEIEPGAQYGTLDVYVARRVPTYTVE